MRQGGPPSAEFAASPPALVLPEPSPDTTIPEPIPRFSDVILTRRRPRVRDGMGVKGAHSLNELPRPTAPAPRAIAETTPAPGSAQPRIFARASLSPSALPAPRGLSTAGIVETLADPAEAPVHVEKPDSPPRVTARVGLDPTPNKLGPKPRLVIGEVAGPSLPAPHPSNAAPRSANGAIRPRQRIRGPGSHQFDPAPPALEPWTGALDRIPAADSPAAPIPAGSFLSLLKPAPAPLARQQEPAFHPCDAIPVSGGAGIPAGVGFLEQTRFLEQVPGPRIPKQLTVSSPELQSAPSAPLPFPAQSAAPEPLLNDAPAHCRPRLRGPGARRYDLALRGFLFSGEIADLPTPAEVSAVALRELTAPKLLLNPPPPAPPGDALAAPPSPQLRAEDAPFLLEPGLHSMPAALQGASAPLRPRHHMAGPGSRQYAPALSGFRRSDEVAEPFKPAPLLPTVESAAAPKTILDPPPLGPFPTAPAEPAGAEPRASRPILAQPPNPLSTPAALLGASAPLRPRHHMAGPGSRQYAPARPGLRATSIPSGLDLFPQPLQGTEPTVESPGAPKPIPDSLPAALAVRQPNLAPPRLLLRSELCAAFPPAAESPSARISSDLDPREPIPFLTLDPQKPAAQPNLLLRIADAIAEPFVLAGGAPAPRTPQSAPPPLVLITPAASVIAANPGPRPRPGILAEPDPAEAFPLAGARLEPAGFTPALEILLPHLAPALDQPSEPQPSRPCGFAATLAPSPLPGAPRCRSASADFSLYPVWLPALFALTEPRAGLRSVGGSDLAAAPGPQLRLLYSEGPGFSGSLAFPSCGSPASDFIERWRPLAATLKLPPPRIPIWKRCWMAARDLWSTAPAFARGMALGIPLAVPALFFAPKLPPPKISVATASGKSSSFAGAIAQRATIDLREDFLNGLGAWRGAPGWQDSWLVDSVGSAQPGRLALYVPSLHLTDYQVEIDSYIQSKALGFVFHAADPANYYAVQIAIRKPGPLPSVVVIRYAVIAGHEESHHEAPITQYLRDDTFYHVLLTVDGEHFGVSLNGQLIDAWSDDRLKSGGIGLFADKGEKADVRSVHLVENDDFLGRLCSQVSQWTADRRTIGAKHE